MCGILGIIPGNTSSSQIDLSDAIAMRDTMAARGPDDAGLFSERGVIFGHRRLAIRDVENGHQPWVSPNRECVLVYNGEIYNDDELRPELRALGFEFRSTCDTEVLMCAWLAWGPECVHKLRGMFAFGIYDFRRKELFLVRDRCGVKPLFYANVGGDFVFASSIAAITRHPGFSAEPNLSTLRHYLATLRLTLDRDTVFQGISTVRPAEILRLSAGQITLDAWWTLPTHTETDVTFADTVSQFEDELRNSVQLRLKSDVDVGMMLSGGVDSNTLAVIAGESSGSRLKGICGGGESAKAGVGDDFEYAGECAEFLDFDYSETRVGPQQYFDTWHKLVGLYETPISTPTDVIIYDVCRDLKRSVGVALGGEGADEILCGYTVPHWSGADFDRSRSLDQLLSPVADQARLSLQQQYGRDSFHSASEHYLATNTLIPTQIQRGLFREEFWDAAYADHAVEKFYDQFYQDDLERSTAEQTAVMLHRVNLESLLSRLDSASMHASLEARVPYTDHILVESAFRTRHSYRIDIAPDEPSPWLSSLELARRGSLRSKRILRDVAGRMMPSNLANRPKASFPTPLGGWLHNEFDDYVQQQFECSSFAQQLFRPDALQQMANVPEQLSMWKWPLLNLMVWGERWFS